jgi:hypothetical protein
MPVNFFLSLAWFSQTILNFTPETPSTEYYPFGVNVTTIDTRGETSTSYLSLTPGIYLNFSQSMQIVLGVNIVKDIGNFKEASNPMSASWIVMPLAKIDLMF